MQLDNLLEEITAMRKQAFAPFEENALPPILFSPEGQPFVVDPQTNQVMPATPEMLQQMGIDPAQLGMGGPEGAPPPGAPPGGDPSGQGAMPPQGGGGAPPPEGGGELEQILSQFDQRIAALEQAMDQFAQMMSDPAAQGGGQQQMPPAGMPAGAMPMQ